MTQVESPSPRRARRTAGHEGAGGHDSAGGHGRADGYVRADGSGRADGYGPRDRARWDAAARAEAPPRASTSTPPAEPSNDPYRQGRRRRQLAAEIPTGGRRRGSHATPYGQGFSWLILWTIIGALIPGTGLIAAGWRRLGLLLLFLLAVATVALGAMATVGNPVKRVIALAVDPKQLLFLAVVAAAVALLWAVLILLTNSQLRRLARLTGGQRAFSWLVVLALIAGVGLPAFEVSHYALIQRDLVSTVFNSSQQTAQGAAPSTKLADPWASTPRVNVLLIGSDAGSDREGTRPDTLILASINTKTGNTVLFSLPRSLQDAIFAPGTGGALAWPDGYYCPNAKPGDECLINAIWAWAEGDGRRYYPNSKSPGLQATEDAVEGVTGLHVDTYALLNLSGFQQFVDAIGGVTVDVHERLPIGGNTHYQVATGGWIEKGNNQHLDGFHALWFARSRWSTTDYSRMQRQRCVIGDIVSQTNPLTIAKAFPKIAKAAKKNLSTGIQEKDLSAWITLAERITGAKVTSLPFTNDVINTVHPDYTQIHALVQAALTPEPETTPTPSASSTPKTKKSTTDLSKAQDVTKVC